MAIRLIEDAVQNGADVPKRNINKNPDFTFQNDSVISKGSNLIKWSKLPFLRISITIQNLVNLK